MSPRREASLWGALAAPPAGLLLWAQSLFAQSRAPALMPRRRSPTATSTAPQRKPTKARVAPVPPTKKRPRRTRAELVASAGSRAGADAAVPMVSPPEQRGPLLFPEQVAALVFHNRLEADWVRRNVAPEHKIRLGHSTVAWYAQDVWAWIEERRGE